MARLPATTAQLRVLRQSFSERLLEGEVSAGGFQWTFRWCFARGQLSVEPSLGRALIQDALLRFLESCIGTGVAVLGVRLWPGSQPQPGDHA